MTAAPLPGSPGAPELGPGPGPGPGPVPEPGPGPGPDGSYYGVPVVHKPHWKWLIVAYFFLGGISGAAFVVATIADVVGPKQDRRIGQIGRYVSFFALLPSPVLLILDLGRPERFLRMVRTFNPRSPMSVGTWGLTVFGFFSGLAAVGQAGQDGWLGRGRPGRVAAALPMGRLGVVGAPFAFFVAGYTGVLLAATAVPLWAKRPHFLGPLFLASALSTATAAIGGVLAILPGTAAETTRRLERLQAVAMVAELGLQAAWVEALGSTAAPIRQGRLGALLRYGTDGAGLVLPLCLQAARRVLPRRWGRPLSVLGAVLVLGGGVVLRYVVVVGGQVSADDPRATFEWARREEGAAG